MNPGKVQDSKVTTLSNPNHTNSGPTRPHLVVGSFLEKLSARELRKGFRRMNKPPKEKPPPNTQSVSILMKAPKGVNSKGRSVWWEEVELWVTCKGREAYLLPPRKWKDVC